MILLKIMILLMVISIVFFAGSLVFQVFSKKSCITKNRRFVWRSFCVEFSWLFDESLRYRLIGKRMNTAVAVRKIISTIPKGDVCKTMEQSGLTQRGVYDWLNGRKSAKLDNLIALANAAGVEVVLVEKGKLEAIREHIL